MKDLMNQMIQEASADAAESDIAIGASHKKTDHGLVSCMATPVHGRISNRKKYFRIQWKLNRKVISENNLGKLA